MPSNAGLSGTSPKRASAKTGPCHFPKNLRRRPQFPPRPLSQDNPGGLSSTTLWVQVLLAIAMATALGFFSPVNAEKMKPLGDGFIQLITMVITLLIFCTVVTGIAGMRDIKKIGRVGGKALLYFEIISTLALLLGLAVGNLVHPGSGLNVNPASLAARAVADYAGLAKAQNATEFLLRVIPRTVVDAFARGDIVQALLVALLFGFAISAMGSGGQSLAKLMDALPQPVFGVVNIMMRFAPIGAFGAMAFTVGR
jgi:aerobic C4-dicarboxylate transport protein